MIKEDRKILGVMIDKSADGLRKEIKAIEERLGQDIRHNGFMMERLEESIQQIAEGHEFIRASLEQINARLDYNKVERVELLWETVKDHSRRIKKLEESRVN